MASSLLLLAALLVNPADAAPHRLYRDVSGQTVKLGDRTLLVPWRIDSAEDLAALRSTAALASEYGVKVVGLNVDAVAERARLLPWLRSHGCEVPTIADPDGALMTQLSARPGEVLVFSEGGAVLAHVLARTSTEGIRAQVANVLGVPDQLLALAD